MSTANAVDDGSEITGWNTECENYLKSVKDQTQREKVIKTKPIRVLITGASGQVAYVLMHDIACGKVFGPNQEIILHLFDLEAMLDMLNGVILELQDCNLPLLKEIIKTSDIAVAFGDIDFAIMMANIKLKDKEFASTLYKRYYETVQIYKQHGEALSMYSKRTVKVVVVARPFCFNALILQQSAAHIPPKNVTGLSRLGLNRIITQVAIRMKVPSDHIKNLIIWGHRPDMFIPDITHGSIKIMGTWKPLMESIGNEHWVKNLLPHKIKSRDDSIGKAIKIAHSVSKAKAITDHLHDWYFGTNENITSMVVLSDGSYGIKSGVFWSFPVTVDSKGEYSIVKDLPVADWISEQLTDVADYAISTWSKMLEEMSHQYERINIQI